MSNPFPGMDPYLEGDLWMTVHTDLCAEIARQLAPKLRPKYLALSARCVVLAAPDDSELADLPLVLPVEMPEPIPHVSIEIRDLASRRLHRSALTDQHTRRRPRRICRQAVSNSFEFRPFARNRSVARGRTFSNGTPSADCAVLRFLESNGTPPRRGSLAYRVRTTSARSTDSALAGRPGRDTRLATGARDGLRHHRLR